MIVPLLFGLIGAAILCALGTWQVQRMQWKAGVLAEIGAMIGADPVALPAAPDPVSDRYRPVFAQGSFTAEAVEVLSGRKDAGAGVRVLQVFVTDDGRRVLVDRGFVADEARGSARTVSVARVTGNLHWPQDADAYTPPPDPMTGLWFARDVPAIAALLHTEPTLIVAREPTGDGIEPMPIDTSAIPNNHREYAITWFSLAAVWLAMTGYLLWRIRQRTD